MFRLQAHPEGSRQGIGLDGRQQAAPVPQLLPEPLEGLLLGDEGRVLDARDAADGAAGHHHLGLGRALPDEGLDLEALPQAPKGQVEVQGHQQEGAQQEKGGGDAGDREQAHQLGPVESGQALAEIVFEAHMVGSSSKGVDCSAFRQPIIDNYTGNGKGLATSNKYSKPHPVDHFSAADNCFDD